MSKWLYFHDVFKSEIFFQEDAMFEQVQYLFTYHQIKWSSIQFSDYVKVKPQDQPFAYSTQNFCSE